MFKIRSKEEILDDFLNKLSNAEMFNLAMMVYKSQNQAEPRETIYEEAMAMSTYELKSKILFYIEKGGCMI